MAGGNPLMLMGERRSGESVRSSNVNSSCAIANILKSSLGPMGLDKMLVDEVGDFTITNDGATILGLMDVEHPAAKILVQLANLQDEEVGDGTTSVVIIAAELLKNAEKLIKIKIHPTSIIKGYRMACKEACKFIEEHMTISEIDRNCLVNAAKTALNSKVIGPNADFFAPMCVDACAKVKYEKAGEVKVPVKAVNILKAHGKNAKESFLVNGYAINCKVASVDMPKTVSNPKIACIGFGLMKSKLKLGVQVLVEDPKKLEEIRRREISMTTDKIKKILETGVNVLFTTGGIDDIYMKYFINVGAMAVRRVLKADIKRVAKATGATFVEDLTSVEGGEIFDSSFVGHAAQVSQQYVGDDELILITGTKSRTAASIIIRGPNYFGCDEIERSIHDALCVTKRIMESKTCVAGGGCVEAALSVYIDSFASTISSAEQEAVAMFAESMTIIPSVLASNACCDAIELLGKLRAYHFDAATKQTPAWFGLDLDEGSVRDNKQAGVLEPTINKIKCLKMATEAAITILRIDDVIKLAPEPKAEPPCH